MRGGDFGEALSWFWVILSFVLGLIGVALKAASGPAPRRRSESQRRPPPNIPDFRFAEPPQPRAPPPRQAASAVFAPEPPRPLKPTAQTILFLDVETTGLSGEDRIVTFGAVKLRLTPPGEIACLHLVFNPERRCSRRAAAIHGWDNRTLARQDAFAPYAAPLRAWCGEAELVVSHNAAFDMRFVNGAFAREGLPPLEARSECTMLTYRARGEGSAALGAIGVRMGLPPRGRHGALEDAWRCMQAFLWMRDLPWRLDFAIVPDPQPANYRPAPAPKRKRGRPRKADVIVSGSPSTQDAAGG